MNEPIDWGQRWRGIRHPPPGESQKKYAREASDPADSRPAAQDPTMRLKLATMYSISLRKRTRIQQTQSAALLSNRNGESAGFSGKKLDQSTNRRRTGLDNCCSDGTNQTQVSQRKRRCKAQESQRPKRGAGRSWPSPIRND